MFVPAPFRTDDFDAIVAIIDQYALATAVSNGQPLPYVTHLPVIRAPRDAEEPTALVGSRLMGHLNRGNPHWQSLSDGDPILLVFQGPSSYISPSVYGRHPVAPTWNFVSIHVHGRLSLREPGPDTLDVVCRTVSRFEANLGTGWDMTESMDYFRRIEPAVGAFDVRVEAVDSQFKLSQDQPPDMLRRVRDRIEEQSSQGCTGMADLMRKVNP